MTISLPKFFSVSPADFATETRPGGEGDHPGYHPCGAEDDVRAAHLFLPAHLGVNPIRDRGHRHAPGQSGHQHDFTLAAGEIVHSIKRELCRIILLTAGFPWISYLPLS